jgi:outer membrane protein OmpA-like peptidoglycan-associated protein
MLGVRSSCRRASKEEAEKPFWISFSDLMTALMVLFLVVMAAALLSVTAGIRDDEARQNNRAQQIGSCMAQVKVYTDTIRGVQLRDHSVDFGTLAKFQNNSSELDQAQQDFLRRFVPRVLDIARGPACQEWLKQIVVEGFASRGGTYLHNLDLSTQRSERVLCTLLTSGGPPKLNEADRSLVENLFFAGGYSFNATRETDEESRRIELKLEFYALKEKQEALLQRKHLPLAFRTNPARDMTCPIDAR